MELEEDTNPSLYSPVHSPIGSSTAPTVSPRATLAMVSPAERLSWVLEEISSIPDFRNSYRKLLHALSRRIRLLSPLADELLDRPDSFPVPAVQTLEPLVIALEEAKEFLKFANEGSKIYLVLERETVIRTHQNVISKLEEALGLISFEELDISDEIKEQVELVRTQLKRAKERNNEIPNDESQLHQELLEIYNDDSNDQNALKNLSSKLHLTTINELMQESLALHEMVAESFDGSDPGENIEKMSMLLKKIKDFIQTQNPKMGTLITPLVSVPDRKMKNTVSVPVPVPDEFRCPISLELMRDPVIVATGQTYERSSIEKWLSTGHDTCPTTHQKLAHKTLTTNYILKSLISHFCETHNLSLPPPPSPLLSPRTDLETLLAKLQSTDLDSQRSASGELRLLAKRNASNRISIARAGAVPILTHLLFSRDSRTQEHAVTALLNLSIFEENKSVIINSNSVPGIVHVLIEGNMEARENAAATLFSLSVVDEYKVVIGTVGTAIPALVRLLSEGSNRGKKDAATALFNLCIYQGNKAKAVRAGLVPLVMGLVAESSGTMVDESMAILAILSGNNEGRVAIGTEETVPVLVEAVRNGTPRNRENAAAVLVNICEEEGILGRAEECGLLNPLRDLAVNGTERGKRKAVWLLEKMSRFLVLKQEISSSSLETRDNVNVDNVL